MSDLEQELTDALAQAAEDAPGAAGLADAARRRHRVRRRRRLVLGGAAAALLIGVGAVGVSAMGGEDRAADPVGDPAPAGWQTIGEDDVRALVPADWERVDCDGSAGPRWAPPVEDPCGEWLGAGFFGSATYDAMTGPAVLQRSSDGVTSSYVSTGAFVLSVSDRDPALVRRILATARLDGQPVVDGSTWVGFDRGALSYEVPAWWGVGEDADRSGYSVCAVPAKGQEAPAPEQVDPAHVVVRQVVGDRMVTVAAPTQAVAELVLATVEVDERARGDAPCAPEDFAVGLLPGESSAGAGVPVEGGERPIDLPTSDWKPGDGADAALITGTLALDADDCVVLAVGSPGTHEYLVWPAGHTASVDESGALTLRGPDGEVVARQGDRIEAGGGWMPAGTAAEHPCLPAGREVAMVQSEVTVVP